MLVLVRCFSYTPHVSVSEVFLSLALLMLILVRSFSFTPDANVNEFVLHSFVL